MEEGEGDVPAQQRAPKGGRNGSGIETRGTMGVRAVSGTQTPSSGNAL